jgi:hypothetical protein
VSCLSFENSINDYGQIEKNDGLFVVSKTEMDNLLIRTGGNISKIEDESGICRNRKKIISMSSVNHFDVFTKPFR